MEDKKTWKDFYTLKRDCSSRKQSTVISMSSCDQLIILITVGLLLYWKGSSHSWQALATPYPGL